jgi:peptidoglycan/LPS O-acetylase OafA/YrhL
MAGIWGCMLYHTTAIYTASHLTYRADVDGLRGMAVALVLGYHAFPAFVQGGLIGVDIFFVISGFLISGIILSELALGKFSFIEFYRRRAIRIFPALIVVLVACLAFGWVTLFADEYSQLGKHVAGGAAFVSNFVLWNEAGYFDVLGETKPLLHLWSLGIEEQFYFVWPLLLWAAWRVRLNILVVAASLAALSFAWNIYGVGKDSIGAFYSPQTRLWELLIGAALACHRHQGAMRDMVQGQSQVADTVNINVGGNPPFASNNGQLGNIISIGGLLLISIGLVAISKECAVPGWWAVLPVAGAAGIVLAGPGAWLNRTVFSARPMTLAGLLSYPMYLWHWPLLSFARILEGHTPSIAVRCGAIAMSVALAGITYAVVEKPIRYGRNGTQWAFILVLGIMTTGTMGYRCFALGGVESRGIAQISKAATAASMDWDYPHSLILKKRGDFKYYATGESGIETIFMGDSHLEQFSPRVLTLLNGAVPQALFVTRGGCPPIPNVFEDKHPACRTFVDEALKIIGETKTLKTIIVGACWNCYFINQVKQPAPVNDPYNFYYLEGSERHNFRTQDGRARALSSLRSFVELLSLHYNVFLLLDNPQGPDFDPKGQASKMRMPYLLSGSLPSQMSTKIQVAADQQRLNEELKRLAAEVQVVTIDQIEHLCPSGYCNTLDDNGRPIHKDSDHLRSQFVRSGAIYIDQVITGQ